MQPIPITRAEYEKKFGKPNYATSTLDVSPTPQRVTRAEWEALQKQWTPEVKSPISRNSISETISAIKDVPSDLKETFKGMVGSVDKGMDTQNEARTQVETGEISPLAGTSKIIGGGLSAGAGVVGNAFTGLLKMFVSPEAEEDVKSGAKKTFDFLRETPGGKDIATAVQDVKTNYERLTPEKQAVVDGLLGAGEAALEVVGLGKGKKVVDAGVDTAVDLANQGRKEVIKKIVEPIKTKLDTRTSLKRQETLYDIESNYASTRKAMNTSVDGNASSRARIAEANIWDNVVNQDGKMATMEKGGAYEKYKNETIEGKESVVRDNLVREGATVNLQQAEKLLRRNIFDSGLEGADLEKALNNVQKELQGLNRRADELGTLPLAKIHDAKINATNNINYRVDSTPSIKYRKAVARTYKEIVENTSKTNVKEVNAELAKYYKDLDLIESFDGRRVKGGKLGKYFAQISGNIVGGAVGGAVGGPVGMAVGTVFGGESASFIKGKTMSNILGKGGKGIPKNAVLEKSRMEAGLPPVQDLRTADKAIGVSKNIRKTKDILAVEGKIKKNVAMQKTAIKDGQYGLVVELKIVYSDLVTEIKELVTQSKSLGNRNMQYKTPAMTSKTPISKSKPQIKPQSTDLSPTANQDVSLPKSILQKGKDFYKKNLSDERGAVNFGAMADDAKKGLTNTQKKTLAVVHNLTGEKLRFSDKIGGITNPSVGIIRPDMNKFEGFGDITLIADNRLLFSGKGKTYGADVYSPRFPTTDTAVKNFKQWNATLKKYGIPEGVIDTDNVYRNITHSDIVKDAFKKQLSKPKYERINEFDDFVDAIIEEGGAESRIFQGFTDSGNRKYLRPVTAEKVSKLMNKEDQRGGEGYFYGLGNVRSKIAPEFKSVAQIKKNEKNIIPSSSFETLKTDYDKEFNSILDEAIKYYKYDKDSFGLYDDIGKALGDYIGGGKSAIDEIMQNYPTTFTSKLDTFARKLAEMPTEYFETKFKRPVQLSEFSHAVVPEGTPESVLRTLKEKNIPYSVYKKGEGNQTKEVARIAAEKGLLFGLGALVFYEEANNT